MSVSHTPGVRLVGRTLLHIVVGGRAWSRFLLFALMVVVTVGSAVAATRVIDGDTLDLDGTRFRIHGIDAPEAGQTCMRPDGGHWPCGTEAIRAMQRLVSARPVTCASGSLDGYGRTVAVCSSGGLDLGRTMVSRGMAFAFRKYSADYAAEEDEARRRRIGVWQADTETPWDYRAWKWKAGVQEAPSGCPIKGNISKGGHIYHAPWSPWYTKTRIDTAKGERWFCTEAEAVGAGWRAPVWGK